MSELIDSILPLMGWCREEQTLNSSDRERKVQERHLGSRRILVEHQQMLPTRFDSVGLRNHEMHFHNEVPILRETRHDSSEVPESANSISSNVPGCVG